MSELDPIAAHRIVIVGGGAGGLELATHLGDRLGRRSRARVILIDRARVHVWKPLLHEIAAGSAGFLPSELSYAAHARRHHFEYRLGEMTGLDRSRREVHLGPMHDDEGNEVTPHRSIGYDSLVIAVGSRTRDFGVPGVTPHAVSLEGPSEAERFHRRLVNALLRAQTGSGPSTHPRLRIAIVGAGSTGVELASELRYALRHVLEYGLDRIDSARDVRLELIELADRVLPGLPPRLSRATAQLLESLGVCVRTSAQVAEVTSEGLRLADGTAVAADMTVWAAGIQAPSFLKGLDGLETNRIDQLVVTETLQTTRDEHIFAIGDCAACPWPAQAAYVPARAQAAHQQSAHLKRQLPRRITGRQLDPFQYRDFGSLVSLGRSKALGELLTLGSARGLFVEGYVARAMYASLRKLHELALHGLGMVTLQTLAELISRRTEPHVKLH